MTTHCTERCANRKTNTPRKLTTCSPQNHPELKKENPLNRTMKFLWAGVQNVCVFRGSLKKTHAKMMCLLGGCVCWFPDLFHPTNSSSFFAHLAGLSKARTMFMFTKLSEETRLRMFFFSGNLGPAIFSLIPWMLSPRTTMRSWGAWFFPVWQMPPCVTTLGVDGCQKMWPKNQWHAGFCHQHQQFMSEDNGWSCTDELIPDC